MQYRVILAIASTVILILGLGLVILNFEKGNISYVSGAVSRGALWTYGSGTRGNEEGQLYTPHMVEDVGDNKLLVVEQSNCDVIIIDKKTRKIVWQFGERGISGTGNKLTSPHSARRIPSGVYKGNIIITEYRGDHRVLIVDYNSKTIVWEYDSLIAPLDAIYWDDDHIMISDGGGNKIVKIRLSDKSIVWEYPTLHPFYLQKLEKKQNNQWGYGNSYGGDLLFGRYYHDPSTVTEIDTSNKSIVWEFGGYSRSVMLADKLQSPVSAYRWGMSESEGRKSGITIIADEGNARVLAVNSQKQIIWEIGGVTHSHYKPISWLIEPTYATLSKNGNLLIVDAMANKIYEISYPPSDELTTFEGTFSTKMLSVDYLKPKDVTNLVDCGLIDLSRRKLSLTVEARFNESANEGIMVHIYTSYDGRNWDIEELKDALGSPIFGDMPFSPGQIQRKTKDIPFNGRFIKVKIKNKDMNYGVSNIGVIATLSSIR